MCDSVLYVAPGRRSRLSTRVGRSAVDVMIRTFEYVAHGALVRYHGLLKPAECLHQCCKSLLERKWCSCVGIVRVTQALKGMYFVTCTGWPKSVFNGFVLNILSRFIRQFLS